MIFLIWSIGKTPLHTIWDFETAIDGKTKPGQSHKTKFFYKNNV